MGLISPLIEFQEKMLLRLFLKTTWVRSFRVKAILYSAKNNDCEAAYFLTVLEKWSSVLYQVLNVEGLFIYLFLNVEILQMIYLK